MSETRTCVHGGSLVGMDAWMPQAAAHYRWGERYPRPGCNALRCGRCGSRVAWWPDLDVAPGAEVDAAGLVAAGPSRDLALKTLIVAAGSRLYACACAVYGERGERALLPAEGSEHPLKALPWACGGHEALALPASLDGEELTLAGLAALVRRALAGSAPRDGVPWPPQGYEAELPAAWLAHLYALLPAGTARVAIAEAVASCLQDPNASSAERTAALDFYLFHPRAPGAERVAELLRDTPERFGGVALPWSKKRDLASLAWKVLIERLHAADDAPALALARSYVLTPGAPQLGVLLRLGHLDAAWVRAHALDMLRANPQLLPSLVDVMRAWSADDALAVIRTLAGAEGVDSAAVGRAVRERLWSPQREAILAALGKT